MEKLLSLIIPTYNMAALLPRCLDSLLEPRTLERLEAIVVNDGSKDDSLAVARRYEAAYPGTVVVIDKPNGNYGSTINAALPVARGLYVKILDSDDSFDTDALAEYLDALEKLEHPADVSVTHFRILHEDGSEEISKYNVYGREPYDYGKVYDLDEVLADGYIRFFLMHALSYRTDLLREHGYRQTEGISYTDTEWSIFPMFYARDIVFHDIVLYRYNLAREGQTMDPKVIAKSLPQMEKMTFSLLDHYEALDREALSPVRKAFLQQFFCNRIRLMSKCHLMDLPREMFDADRFAEVDGKLQEYRRRLDLPQIKLYPVNKIIRFDIYRHWTRHRARPPKWFESVNAFVDTFTKAIYVRMFRR